eukprot:scaffold1706_cov116-Cylindrotheca_fusiformis.AAC.13
MYRGIYCLEELCAWLIHSPTPGNSNTGKSICCLGHSLALEVWALFNGQSLALCFASIQSKNAIEVSLPNVGFGLFEEFGGKWRDFVLFRPCGHCVLKDAPHESLPQCQHVVIPH